MKMGRWMGMGLCSALAALAVAASPRDATAQADDRDCRCVDADGDAIDNCSCFVIPDFDMEEALAWSPGSDFGWSFRSARPRLGVTVSTRQDEELDTQGARVNDVMDDGPADDGGIREGDIITSVDGRSLFEPLDDDVEEDFDPNQSIPVQRLLALSRDLEPGQTVQIGYLRDGEARTATVEASDLGREWGEWARQFREELRPRMERFQRELRPQLEELRDQIREQSREWERNGLVVGGVPTVAFNGGVALYGLRLTELTPGLGEYFGTDHGVLVTDVDDDSPLGLRPGDVILTVGDREATSPVRVVRILSSYDSGESVTFRVRRQGSEIDVMGRLSN